MLPVHLHLQKTKEKAVTQKKIRIPEDSEDIRNGEKEKILGRGWLNNGHF